MSRSVLISIILSESWQRVTSSKWTRLCSNVLLNRIYFSPAHRTVVQWSLSRRKITKSTLFECHLICNNIVASGYLNFRLNINRVSKFKILHQRFALSVGCGLIGHIYGWIANRYLQRTFVSKDGLCVFR